MKIIVLFGKGEKGKSTTLKEFLRQIMEKYSITAVNRLNDKRFNATDLKEELAVENKSFLTTKNGVNNYVATFEIGGKKYGVTTRGDRDDILENDFKFFKGCDVVFCATRTKGETVEFIENQNEEVLWVAKTYISDYRKSPENTLDFINYTNQKQVEILIEIFNNI